ncbi:MAG: hypothetical protein IJE00_05950, partial [Clostridia bacterium]|nr:hypothetical protein [Clostridia bacterium]MBQ2939895.1 hypothetical protein [Clostridia bacterium]
CTAGLMDFGMIFVFSTADRLAPFKGENGKSAQKTYRRRCGVRFSYGIGKQKKFPILRNRELFD